MKMGNTLKISLCLMSTLFVGNALAVENQQPVLIAAISQDASDVKQDVKKDTSDAVKDAKKDAKEGENYLSDAEITAKVKEKFIAEKLFGKEKISAMGIHVKTNKGVVYLKGKVSTQEQADNAIALAKGVSGVKDVKSSIKIKTSAQKK